MPPKMLRRKLWRTTRTRRCDRNQARAYVYGALAEIRERERAVK